MYKIKTNSDYKQVQNFELFGFSLELTLKFNEVGLVWQYDLRNMDTGEIYASNKGLAVNAPSLINKNLPFVFMLFDNTNKGINCVDITDLDERLSLYAVGKDEFKEAFKKVWNV